MYRKICLTMLMFDFLHVASAQTAENPSINDDAEPNTKEIEIKEFDVLGVFDRMRFETEDVALETRKKPIFRLASSSESTLERQPLRSIDDPERAGVFPFQPVNINPWRKNTSLGTPLIVPNTSEDHECDPFRVVPPYRVGFGSSAEVATHFEATCEVPEPGDTAWTLVLELFSPTENYRDTRLVLTGQKVKFHRSNTQIKLDCESGKWKARAKL